MMLARLAEMTQWREQLLADRLTLYRDDLAAWLSGAAGAVVGLDSGSAPFSSTRCRSAGHRHRPRRSRGEPPYGFGRGRGHWPGARAR